MSDASHNSSDGHDRPHKQHAAHGHGGGHDEGHEGAPEWLISFADMVMLMMGFFVILFALNNKPTGRETGGSGDHRSNVGAEATVTQVNEHVLDFAIGVREAFNNPVSVNSNDPRDAPLVRRMLQRAGTSETRDPGIKGTQQDVQSIRPGDYYALSGSVAFPENASDLPSAAHATISEIARKVRGLRLVLEVRGHVSSVEASQGPESAMQLATARAMTVAKALAAEGVAWWQMSLISSADHDRVEAHPTNRNADRANSRVEVIITDKVVPDEVRTRYEDGQQAGGGWSSFGGASGRLP